VGHVLALSRDAKLSVAQSLFVCTSVFDLLKKLADD
jgi:hypothetical protein